MNTEDIRLAVRQMTTEELQNNLIYLIDQMPEEEAKEFVGWKQ